MSTTNRLLTAIVILMTLAALYFAKDVILPVVLGLLLALTLGPWVRWLSRRGVPASLSAALLILGFAGLIGAGALVLRGPVINWFDDIPRISFELRDKLRGVTESMAAVQDASKQVEDLAKGGEDSINTVVLQQPGLLTAAVSNLASFITSLVVGLILALFLLSTGNLFYIKIVESFPRFGDKKRALTVIYEIEKQMSRYIVAITSINAALGIAIGGAMYLLNMPYPFVWGLAAFTLNFLPFLGGIVGTLGVGAFAIVHFDSFYYAMLAPIAYQSLTAVEGQVLTPVLLGARMQVNAVAVFLTVIFWAWLWGIPGALMAVPILVLVKVVCDHVPALSTFGNFLGGRAIEPVPQEPKTVVPAS
ncbi:AI-2E family transporter [Roseovarius sp.]|uniref:AI-2E family transporter n=1 Tax=Roseovarius sp. TaxID=1486281 RepID=UPI003569E773